MIMKNKKKKNKRLLNDTLNDTESIQDFMIRKDKEMSEYREKSREVYSRRVKAIAKETENAVRDANNLYMEIGLIISDIDHAAKEIKERREHGLD